MNRDLANISKLYSMITEDADLTGIASKLSANISALDVYKRALGKKQRLPGLEKILLEVSGEGLDSLCWAYHYAVNVVKGPWAEGEAVLLADPVWGPRYKAKFA